MLEIADTDLKTYPFDHHGLIAAVCKYLRIAERLLDAPISAQELNDHTLGHALDDLSDYGVSRLFGPSPSVSPLRINS